MEPRLDDREAGRYLEPIRPYELVALVDSVA
jgi:hypothetical protein